jgi:hypothetical protein
MADECGRQRSGFRDFLAEAFKRDARKGVAFKSKSLDDIEHGVFAQRLAQGLPPPRSGAVAIGKKIVAVNVFDKPTTCKKVWNRLLSGFVLDALVAAKSDEIQASAADVLRIVNTTSGMSWVRAEPVGEGEEVPTFTLRP